MDGLHDPLGEVLIQPQVACLVEAGVNHVLIALRLNNPQVVFFLETTYLTRHAHAPCQHGKQFVIAVIYLLAH